MSSVPDAVRRAARVLSVPGTPRSLELHRVAVDGGEVTLAWSFLDPEVFAGDPALPRRRVGGTTTAPLGQDAERGAVAAWATAQLDAGLAFKRQVDGDWIPGTPPITRVWTPDDAWRDLLGFLSVHAHVEERDGAVVATYASGERLVFRVDPAAWADFVNGVHLTPATEDDAGEDDGHMLPAGFPLVEGLPLWVVDELEEASGAWGPTIALRNGRIVGE